MQSSSHSESVSSLTAASSSPLPTNLSNFLVLSGSNDKTLILTNPDHPNTPLTTFRGHGASIRSFAVHENLIYSASSDKTIRVFNIDTGRCIKTIRGHNKIVRSICVTKDGSRVITGSDDHTLKVWNAETGLLIDTLRGHSNTVNHVSLFESDVTNVSLLVSSSDDGTAILWNLSTLQRIRTIRGHPTWIWSTIFSSDGSNLITASKDSCIKIWNTNTGNCIATIRGHARAARCLAVVKDPETSVEYVISGSYDAKIKIWNLSTFVCVGELSGHGGPVYNVVVSGDGRFIYSCGDDRTIRIWSRQNLCLLRTIRVHSEVVTYVLPITNTPQLRAKFRFSPFQFPPLSESSRSNEAQNTYSITGHPAVDESRIANMSELDRSELTCLICTDIIIDPSPKQTCITPCCSHLFCTMCIYRWITSNPTCPKCRSTLSISTVKPLNRLLRKFLFSNLKLKCRYHYSFSFDDETHEINPNEASNSSTGASVDTPVTGSDSVSPTNSSPLKSLIDSDLGGTSSSSSRESLSLPDSNSDSIKSMTTSNENDSPIIPLEDIPDQEKLGDGDNTPFEKEHQPTFTKSKSILDMENIFIKENRALISLEEYREKSANKKNQSFSGPIGGCHFIGSLDQILSHEPTCSFEPWHCPNEGCTATNLVKSQMDSHLEICPCTMIQCPAYGCKEVLLRSKVINHMLFDCDNVLLLCPNLVDGCGCPHVERHRLGIHLNTICPLGKCPCKYADQGCKWRGLKKSLQLHLLQDCHFYAIRDYVEKSENLRKSMTDLSYLVKDLASTIGSHTLAERATLIFKSCVDSDSTQSHENLEDDAESPQVLMENSTLSSFPPLDM